MLVEVCLVVLLLGRKGNRLMALIVLLFRFVRIFPDSILGNDIIRFDPFLGCSRIPLAWIASLGPCGEWPLWFFPSSLFCSSNCVTFILVGKWTEERNKQHFRNAKECWNERTFKGKSEPIEDASARRIKDFCSSSFIACVVYCQLRAQHIVPRRMVEMEEANLKKDFETFANLTMKVSLDKFVSCI